MNRSKRRGKRWLLESALLFISFGCQSNNSSVGANNVTDMGLDSNVPESNSQADGAVHTGREAGTIPSDQGIIRDSWAGRDGGAVVETDGEVIINESGRTFTCRPTLCRDKLLECGDCIDNDGDNRTDWNDPECLGPCDNTEGPGLSSGVGGETRATCRLDCYFDFGNGPGNDDCHWDHRCDRLEPEAATCEYEPRRLGSRDCPEQQSQTCEDTCLELTPNGCDCFGCCTFPELDGLGPNGTSAFVWIGHLDANNESTCTLDSLGNTTACPRCTPVDACKNDCGECEICVGKPEIPDHCFEQDAGMSTPDAGVTDGAVPSGPSNRCPEGAQACGTPQDPRCPDTHYCITGCCVFAG